MGTEMRVSKEALFRSLGYKPHEGQWAIHRSGAPRRVVACGVRWGKTLCAAMEGVAAAMQPAERSVGWVCAPTYDLADRVFKEIMLIVAQHLRHRVISMKERRLVIRNMGGGTSEIQAKTADNPVSLLGEGLDWLVVDEAARLKPMIWESHLSQRLIDKRGWALLISTPKGKGYLYDLFKRGQGGDPDFESWNFPSWSNPLLDAAVIEQERGRLPERVFAQEYGAQFTEGSGAVFRNVRECATGEWQEPVAGAQYYAGLDLAKISDYTVLVIMNRDREVVFVDRFHRLDWGIQVQRIQVACEKYNDAELICDSTGVGEPVYESLCAENLFVEPFTFSSKSKNALIKNMAIDFEQKRITLPRPELWPEGTDEAEAYMYSVTDSGNVRMASPSSGHDDCVIATALAAWHLREEASFHPTVSVMGRGWGW